MNGISILWLSSGFREPRSGGNTCRSSHAVRWRETNRLNGSGLSHSAQPATNWPRNVLGNDKLLSANTDGWQTSNSKTSCTAFCARTKYEQAPTSRDGQFAKTTLMCLFIPTHWTLDRTRGVLSGPLIPFTHNLRIWCWLFHAAHHLNAFGQMT